MRILLIAMDIRIDAFREELEFSYDLIILAGGILLDHHGKPLKVELKEDGTKVTDVDRLVSDLVSPSFEARFPGYAVVDEERKEDNRRYTSADCLFIDPLDDTSGYIRGGDDFGVIFGRTHGNTPVWGMSFKPAKKEVAYAVKGHGAYLVKDGVTARLEPSESEEIHVLVSRSRRGEELDAILKDLNPDSVAYMGGSLKIIEVAKGDSTVFICPQKSTMHLWDLCGPSVFLEESGGRISDLHRDSFDYRNPDTANHNGVVAARNEGVYRKVFDRIGHLYA
ncbi:MAG: hypothetical protein HY518_02915 [Candidatus Aenigmarchaeota archaeon]|nr:hypothetical protein [Candidatus Aenigmarchaeota archaeon]